MVPISAHALFARPMVVAPTSVLAVEVIAGTDGGRACCGATGGAPSSCRRAPASRSGAAARPIRLARLHEAPFTDRLVAKFGLPGHRLARAPPSGAPARGRRPMLEEIRIRALGVIEESVLELGPGFTAMTGETGAGKTMVVTALGPAAGRPRRPRCGPHRSPRARVEGVVRRAGRSTAVADRRRGRRRRARGRPAAAGPPGVGRGPVAGLRRRCRRPGRTAGPARRVARRRARPVRPAPAAACGGPARRPRPVRRRRRCAALRDRFAAGHAALRAAEAELAEVVATARERAREADLLRFGLEEIEEVDPQPGEDTELAAEESRLGLRRHAAGRRRAGPRARSPPTTRRPRRPRRGRHGPPTARRRARPRPRGGGLADRLAELSYVLSDLAADVASYASGLETDPARLAAVSERRAALRRPHPQVRRHRRRGAVLGPDLGRTAGRPRRHRRPDRAAAGAAPGDPRRARRASAPTCRRGGRPRRPAPRRGGDRGAHRAGHAARRARRSRSPSTRSQPTLPTGSR